MFSKLINKLTTTFYIQIGDNRFKVTNIKTGNTYEDTPLIAIKDEQIQAVGKDASVYPYAVNPFAHKRILFDHFELASMIMRYAFEQTFSRALFSPLAVVHVMKKFDTPLTDIEKQMLCELVQSVGVREMVLYEGTTLDTHYIDYDKIKEISFSC
jgi:rod shape-determining protein MreB